MSNYTQYKTSLLDDWTVSLMFDDNGTMQQNVVLKKGTEVYVRYFYISKTFLVMDTDTYHPINGCKRQFNDSESLDLFVKTDKKWFK